MTKYLQYLQFLPAIHRCHTPRVGILLTSLVVHAVIGAAEPAQSHIQLLDVTSQSKITFRHTDGGSGQKYIVEFMVGGLALFDYDGDSLIDVFFTNGAPLRGTAMKDPPPTD